MMDPSRQLRRKPLPDLPLIPVAAMEIHPKTWPPYQPFKELFLIHPQKSLPKILPTQDTPPQIFHFNFSQAAKL